MAQAITSYECFGHEIDEPLAKRWRQVMIIRTTGANTDTTYDFDVDAGTFWTAVANAGALAAIKAIQGRAKAFIGVRGPELEAKSHQGQTVQVLSGTVASGSASPAATVAGLLTTDTVLAVTQNAKGANSLPLLGYDTVVAGGFTARYSADPGANGTVLVAIARGAGTKTPTAGAYVEAVTNKRPDIVFASGDAPTAATFFMEWDLQPDMVPVVTSG